MVDVHIAHPFISAKADSADPTLVSSSEWNAFLGAVNGNNGQMIIRNNTSAQGMTWADGPSIVRPSDSFSGSQVTTPALCSTPLTFASGVYVLLLPSVAVTLTAGNAAILSIRRNAAVIATGAIRCDSTYFTPFPAYAVEVAGTYTYDILISGTSGSVTNVGAILTIFSIGKL
jgi:hypothetical protein